MFARLEIGAEKGVGEKPIGLKDALRKLKEYSNKIKWRII